MPDSGRDEALRELGHAARDRREEARLSLKDVFERTRVRIEFLQGIEEGDYQGFPDQVYIRGFVRTYLNVIGADDLRDEFLARLKKENTRERHTPPQNVLGNSTTPTRGFKPASHFWLFVLLFLVLFGTGGYVWYSWPGSGFAFLQEQNEGPSSPAPVSDDLNSGDNVLPVMSEDSHPQEILPPSPPPDPAPEPVKPKPFLQVRARSDVWMKVTIGDKVLYSKTLKLGEKISWDLPSAVKVTFGRPNAAEVVLNGKELGLVNTKSGGKPETHVYNPDGTHRQL